ncbi:hypothetical protein FAVG1_12842 [Fusarium avenaceum]|nr:hypothetical protein FAVG1_12842 [Fusarium avenaceum]
MPQHYLRSKFRNSVSAPSTPRCRIREASPPSSPLSRRRPKSLHSESENEDESESENDIFEQEVAECYSLLLPVPIADTPDTPYTLHLCVHPNWRPGPDAVVHLVQDTAIISLAKELHRPNLVCLEYTPQPDADAETEDFPQRGRRLFGITFASALFFLVLFILGTGQPVWLTSHTTVETAEYELAQPISLIYHDYEERLIPLITLYELAHNPLMPISPFSIIRGLQEEMYEIKTGLHIWQESSLPGPSRSLMARMARCDIAFKSLHNRFRDLYAATDILIQAISPHILSHAINASAVDGHTAFAPILKFWQMQNDDNRAALQPLVHINEILQVIDQEVAPIFADVDSNLRPQMGHRDYDWVDDSLDAIDFSRSHILKLIDSISLYVQRGIDDLTRIDSQITKQIAFWEDIQLNNGTTAKTTYRPWSTKWDGLVVKKQVVTHWHLADDMLAELSKVAIRGKMLGVQVDTDAEAGRSYIKVRPARPSDGKDGGQREGDNRGKERWFGPRWWTR